jgi:hypothetical protein
MTTENAPHSSLARFDRLDDEASRWLRHRAVARAEKCRPPSPLDGLAMALRNVRTTLAEAYAGGAKDERVSLVIERAYRFVIRIARELETIERADLEPMDEWSRFESFAPFGVAFFDRMLEPPMRQAGGATFLRADLAPVLDVFHSAMQSSAMAA